MGRGMSDTAIADRTSLDGRPDNITESWLCVDCGVNTAPGFMDGPTLRQALEEAGEHDGVDQTIDGRSEVYMVRAKVWKQAGMQDFGACLCIGCLERRLGRRLKPKDFLRGHAFNATPGTPRLLDRRKYWHEVR
jgi:hypothetical protein